MCHVSLVMLLRSACLCWPCAGHRLLPGKNLLRPLQWGNSRPCRQTRDSTACWPIVAAPFGLVRLLQGAFHQAMMASPMNSPTTPLLPMMILKRIAQFAGKQKPLPPEKPGSFPRPRCIGAGAVGSYLKPKREPPQVPGFVPGPRPSTCDCCPRSCSSRRGNRSSSMQEGGCGGCLHKNKRHVDEGLKRSCKVISNRLTR